MEKQTGKAVDSGTQQSFLYRTCHLADRKPKNDNQQKPHQPIENSIVADLKRFHDSLPFWPQ
jgi:hypothetical protein